VFSLYIGKQVERERYLVIWKEFVPDEPTVRSRASSDQMKIMLDKEWRDIIV
jgi:hypothetical protein